MAMAAATPVRAGKVVAMAARPAADRARAASRRNTCVCGFPTFASRESRGPIFSMKNFTKKISWPHISHSGFKYFIESPYLATSTVSYWYRAGARFSPIKKQGLSHLVEHLLFQNHAAQHAITPLLHREELGIESNAFTGTELCHFYHNQLITTMRTSTILLKKTMESPYFSEQKLRDEKKAVLHEQIERSQSGYDMAWQLAQESLFHGMPLAHNIFGTPATIKSITLKDCRAFYNKNYSSPHIFFTSNIHKKILHRGNTPMKAVRHDPHRIPEPPMKPVPLVVKKTTANRATLLLSFRSPSARNIHKRVVVAMIRDILANFWSSRCNIELRAKKSLVYWVSGTMETYSDSGILSFHTSCAMDDVRRVSTLLLQQCDDLKKIIISAAELKKVIALLTYNTISQMQNSYALTTWYAPEIIFETGLTMEQYCGILQNTTPQDIQAVAQELFDVNNRTVTIIE